MEPSNKDVRALKLRYKKEAAAANAKDKAMYQRAFQKLAKMPDTEPKMPDTEPKPAPQSHPIDGELLLHQHGPSALSFPSKGSLRADVLIAQLQQLKADA